jgi:Holliday junction DNA helicase RuvB
MDCNETPNIRPASFEEFIGQLHITEPLSVALCAALQRREPLGHVLFSGPPGLGKTTLAQIIAAHMGAPLLKLNGAGVTNAADLVAVLVSIDTGQVLFLDEIHRVPRVCQEVLYPAMEDFEVSVIAGKGEEAHAIKMHLPPFTLIGATTRTGLVSAPLRDRFKHRFIVEHYSAGEIEIILQRAEGLLGLTLEPQARKVLAEHSRGTPRVALTLLDRCRDYAQVRSLVCVDQADAAAILQLNGVQPLGLDRRDVAILEALVVTHAMRPTGLSTLAAALHEEKDTIAEEHEPYLLRMGLMDRTPRGRQATMRAWQYLAQIGRVDGAKFSCAAAGGLNNSSIAARA